MLAAAKSGWSCIDLRHRKDKGYPFLVPRQRDLFMPQPDQRRSDIQVLGIKSHGISLQNKKFVFDGLRVSF